MSALYTGPVTGRQVVDMMQTTEKKRVTLQDIAARTGVSVNTVSHALRNKSDISAETCRRIQEAAREMGYTGNQIARSLRSGRTHIIAVILGAPNTRVRAAEAGRLLNAGFAALSRRGGSVAAELGGEILGQSL